ncbi:HD-GYP domain-containing protein [Candidatus Riflebacteria bacterium]
MKNKPIILYVDDEKENLSSFKFLFQDTYKVKIAISGEEGLKLLKESGNEIPLVISDQRMPGLSGVDFLKKVREIDPDIARIILTGYTDIQAAVNAINKSQIFHYLTKPFVEGDIRITMERALESYYLKKENLRARLETIMRLGRAAEHKDEDTGLHVRRMAHYSRIIAEKMGLTVAEIKAIFSAAPLHDVGKIGIPDAILTKPGKLNEDEWKIMKSHPKIGADILHDSESDLLQLGEEIALTHHEKWDGSGYPAGLKGNNIPLTGRIVALADVFDALSSKRPYKEPFPLDKCFSIIKEGIGSHFDPKVVDAFFQGKDEILSIREKYQKI